MVKITTALYTAIFVCIVKLLLENSRSLRLSKADEARLMRLRITIVESKENVSSAKVGEIFQRLGSFPLM